jgi:hemoglobin
VKALPFRTHAARWQAVGAAAVAATASYTLIGGCAWLSPPVAIYPTEMCCQRVPEADPASLFYRLGRYDGLKRIADSFVDAVAADKRIAGYFEHVDANSLKYHLEMEIAHRTGGALIPPIEDPDPSGQVWHTRPSTKDTLKSVHITEEIWNVMAEDMLDSLERLATPPHERQELLGVLGGMKGGLVDRSSRP